MLLPRQDNRGDVKVIYENGQFVDDRFAELFNCVADVAESNPNFGLLPPVNQPDPPAPPPPSPSPTSPITPNPQGEPGDGLPIAPPQPPRPNTGSEDPAPGPNCNTVDHINGAEPPKGNPPASFLVDDMQELFTKMCDGAKRYPLDEDVDKTYENGRDDTTGPPYEAKVRLVATARALEGDNVGIYDKGRCKENFQAIMDECEFSSFFSFLSFFLFFEGSRKELGDFWEQG